MNITTSNIVNDAEGQSEGNFSSNAKTKRFNCKQCPKGFDSKFNLVRDGSNDDHPDVRNNLGENSQPPVSQVQISQQRCLSR